MKMRIEVIFYFIGIIFSIAAVIYFAYNYVVDFPKLIKLLILLALLTLFYALANYLQKRDL